MFAVKIPERPNGKALKCCFDSLVAQMVNNKSLDQQVTRLRINTIEKQIEIEVNA